jgi:hypothetical protein
MTRMPPGSSPALTARRPHRRRPWLLVLVALVVALGLGSRTAGARAALPAFIPDHAGDTLYAVLVYLLLLLVAPRLPVRAAAAGALALCVLVELSQRVHTPWLDALRAHRLVALVLGRGFLASDLLCYALGVGLAAAADRLLSRAAHA